MSSTILTGVVTAEWAARYIDCRVQKFDEAAMYGFRCAYASRSTIFDTVVKFVSLKLCKADVEMSGSFSSIDTKSVFMADGNRLKANDRFAM